MRNATTGGYFLDFDRKPRNCCALRANPWARSNDVVESAIGGKNRDDHGRRARGVPGERALRPRFSRRTSTRFKRVLVPTPTGAQVPISMLADINYKTGAPSIRNENGQLVGFVFVDITTSDIDGYVRSASQKPQSEHPIPARLLHPMGRPIRIPPSRHWKKNCKSSSPSPCSSFSSCSMLIRAR